MPAPSPAQYGYAAAAQAAGFSQQALPDEPLSGKLAGQRKVLNPYLSLKAQLLGVLGSYLVARLYLVIWFDSELPGSLRQWMCPIFTAAFLVWGESMFALREKGGAPQLARSARLEALFWAVCTLCLSFCEPLGLGNAAKGWSTLFWHGFAVYWVLCRSGLLVKQRSSAFFAWDALNAILILPFGDLFLRLRTLWAGIREPFALHKSHPIDKKQVSITLGCIVMAVPAFCLAANLLAQADSGFAAILHGFRFDFELPYRAQNELLTWLFSLPVGAYLYGLVGGAARRSGPNDGVAQLEQDIEHLRFAPAQAGKLITAAFCLLYTFFFAVQAGYLVGVLSGQLPAGFSVSQYAREGFYQLCGVMLLNFALLTVCAKLSAAPVRRSRALKGFCVLLMIFCLLFAVTAFSKLLLYIWLMGFTPRRLLSSWAVLVFAAGSVFSIATLAKPARVIDKFIWFAAATFTVLCLCY